MTRAIHQECPLGIEYHSITSGRTEREIVPFALIDNGLRWHVRAFDRKSQEFRDFVITRIKCPVVLKDDPVAPHETSNQDIQWTRIVELELVPHPDQPRPEITEMDYSMDGGVLRMKLLMIFTPWWRGLHERAVRLESQALPRASEIRRCEAAKRHQPHAG